ncbi:glycosyltransferase family 4 protein [Legionella drancourtii]|nr:glycosyltransferase family 1 protein [Legionella drancourtii]
MNSMNIIIDVTRVVRRLMKSRTLTGIDRVTMAYVQHYAPIAHALVRWSGRSWVLSRSQSNALFKWLITPGKTSTAILIIFRGILTNSNTKNKAHTFLLNTGHIGLGQSDYIRLIRKRGIKPIFFVHDLIPITYPEYCSAGEDIRHKEKINYVLALASGIITNSQATRQELMHYAQQTKQQMPSAEVALLASGILAKSPGTRPLDKPYFVILSTIEPRKNHLLLLQIWRSLFQRLGQQTPHLFVIGQRGWECENVLDLLERCHYLQDVVTEISYCQDADLVTYIHHSQALLFPSFIEGYGLPLVEALTMGVPVIASDLSVFREIAGNTPEYLNPLDGKRWEELIIEYAQPNSTCRAAQMMRLQHFQEPTWQEHFLKVDSLLTELSH